LESSAQIAAMRAHHIAAHRALIVNDSALPLSRSLATLASNQKARSVLGRGVGQDRGMLIFGGIITLACLAYFLNEAAHAPVVEDDEPLGAEEATRTRNNTFAHKLQAAIHCRLAGKNSRQ
jgi:hypothetical protein